MPEPEARANRLERIFSRQGLMIVLLAIAGGSVDAMIILSFNILAGAQTGNSVLLAAAIAQGQLATALGSSISVLGFVAGVTVGEFIIVRHHPTWHWPSPLVTVLIGELIALGCLLIFWHLAGPHPDQKTSYVLIMCAASVMGMQSSAMLLLDHSPTTTYITGTLTTFATKLIRWLRSVKDASASSPELRSSIMRDLAVDNPWIYGLAWLVYVGGAVVGGFLFLHLRATAVMLPIITIAVAAIAGRSVEKDQVNSDLKRGTAGTGLPKTSVVS